MAQWVETNGGPLVAMPRRLLRLSEGADPPRGGRVVRAGFRWRDPADAATDYDRACDVTGYLGVLAVGDGQALVLGDEPMRTCFVPSEKGGVFVRWRHARSARDVAARLSGLPGSAYQPEPGAFTVASSPVVVFDAACPGCEVAESLAIDLPPGTYGLATRRWEPDAETSLLLHRLERSGVR